MIENVSKTYYIIRLLDNLKSEKKTCSPSYYFEKLKTLSFFSHNNYIIILLPTYYYSIAIVRAVCDISHTPLNIIFCRLFVFYSSKVFGRMRRLWHDPSEQEAAAAAAASVVLYYHERITCRSENPFRPQIR